MPGLQPPNVLGRLDRSTDHRPQPSARRERDGIGPVMDRADPLELLEPRWQDVLVLTASIAAGGTEIIASRLLHQPFSVDHIHLDDSTSTAGDTTVNLFADSIETGAATAGQTLRRGLFQVDSDGTVANQVFFGLSGASPLHIGQLIRRVPCRIVGAYGNASAAAIVVQAIIRVTFYGDRGSRTRLSRGD